MLYDVLLKNNVGFDGKKSWPNAAMELDPFGSMAQLSCVERRTLMKINKIKKTDKPVTF